MFKLVAIAVHIATGWQYSVTLKPTFPTTKICMERAVELAPTIEEWIGRTYHAKRNVDYKLRFECRPVKRK